MCCNCKCDRDCTAPIVPPNDKAKNYKVALYVVSGFHIALFCVKVYLMGLFSGITDLVAIIILYVALCRYDYCQLMLYIVLNLFEVFALIVVLGYYLQTDMGKNTPSAEKERAEKEQEEKDKEQQSNNESVESPTEV